MAESCAFRCARFPTVDIMPNITTTFADYVAKLLTRSVELCKTALPLKEAFKLDAETPRPPCMSESFERPSKEDLVAARLSRFAKQVASITG